MKAGRLDEARSLMEANDVTKNISNPRQPDENLLSAAILVRDGDFRRKMIALVKRVGPKPAVQQSERGKKPAKE